MAYKFMRQHRYERLREAGFLPYEARELSKRAILNRPYTKGMIKERKALLRQAEKEGWSKTKYRGEVKKSYTDKNMKTPWDIFRSHFRKSVDAGDYTPPPKKPKGKLSKGDIKGQKARRREREKAFPPGTQTYVDSSGQVRPLGRVVFNEATGQFETEYS